MLALLSADTYHSDSVDIYFGTVIIGIFKKPVLVLYVIRQYYCPPKPQFRRSPASRSTGPAELIAYHDKPAAFTVSAESTFTGLPGGIVKGL